jgi:hypothetical protein
MTEQMKSEAYALAMIVDSDGACYDTGAGYVNVWYGDTLATIPIIERLIDEAVHVSEMLHRHSMKFNKRRR